jgi:pyruvate dehydrogenase E2 component (dihydrolipoamide acetyltransferase)
MKGYKRTAKLGSFRRMANAFWGEPTDGRIYGTMFLDVSKAMALSKEVEKDHGLKLSMGVFIGKAISIALKRVPQFNAKKIWGTFYEKDSVDVYFQVDIEGGGDLSGTVVEKADQKTIIEIAKELKAKSEKLRKGQDDQYEKTQKGLFGWLPPLFIRWILSFLIFIQYNLGVDLRWFGIKAKPDPFGTVMVTNVGMFGIDLAYAPLVTPARVPLVALVGRVVDQAVVVDGKIEIRPILTASATFDHRYGDGYHIGKIVRAVRHFVENPHLGQQIPADAKSATPTAATDGATPPAAPAATPTSAPAPAATADPASKPTS